MSLSPRGAEVQAVVDLLEDETYDSAKTLAGAILRTAFALFQQRETYVLAVPTIESRVAIYGPYASPTDAEKAGKRSVFDAYAVRPVFPEELLFAQELPVAKGTCKTCKHPQGTHEHPKQAGRYMANFNAKTKTGCDCRTFT